MKTYTEDFKKSIVQKALANPERSPRHTALEAGLGNSTLYGWIKKYGGSIEKLENTPKKSPQDWTSEERFNMLLETANLTEEAQGVYCRQKGIYQHQLAQWREAFMKPKTEINHSKELAELKLLRAENLALKKDLNRKDKALAETSALLILKKKADLLWGEIGED